MLTEEKQQFCTQSTDIAVRRQDMLTVEDVE